MQKPRLHMFITSSVLAENVRDMILLSRGHSLYEYRNMLPSAQIDNVLLTQIYRRERAANIHRFTQMIRLSYI